MANKRDSRESEWSACHDNDAEDNFDNSPKVSQQFCNILATF